MAGNSNLHMSKAGKTDEFYTQLSTIEEELRHYRKYFKGKTVLCNCDDPYESNFFKYFALNFNALGLPVPPTIWRRTMCRVLLSGRNTLKPLSGGLLPVMIWIR